MTPQELPIVLITPEAQAELEAEAERAGVGGDLAGGLLFGHPLDKQRRLVVSSTRLRAEVGFGRDNFALNQTRTSRQLDRAQSLDPDADYCGVWYIHRVPTADLKVEELDQAEVTLDDPDFHFDDLVCLVLCCYGGEVNFHAFVYQSQRMARGLPPESTTLRVTTEEASTEEEAAHPPPQSSRTDWYKSPEAARRLIAEQKRLTSKYQVEMERTPAGQVLFQLRPREEFLGRHLAFYLSCGSGFPERAPKAFLRAGGKRHALLAPILDDWSPKTSLVEVADEVMAWLPRFLDEHMEAAREALDRGDHQEAADLLTVVLTIDPRTSGAARLLAKAQAQLGSG